MLNNGKINCYNTYVTVFEKEWCENFTKGFDLFKSEIHELVQTEKVKKIISLGQKFLNDGKGSEKESILENPVFYSNWRNIGWKNYREQFKKLIEE